MNPYKVYISGPMQTKPGFNFPQFCEAEEWLSGITGHLHLGMFGSIEVVNPARNFNGDTTLGREVYLELALRQVDECDCIVMLPEWEQSPGARLELARALHNGSQVFEWHPGTGGKRVFLPISHSAAQERLNETATPMQAIEWPAPPAGTEWSDHKVTDLGGFEIKPGEHPFYTINDARRGKFAGDEGYEFKEIVNPYETIEDEASRLVRNGARQGTYGHPRGDFDTIARIWAAILSKSNGFEVKVEAEQVALCMAGLKLSRLARDSGHHDSKVDVIGYMICLDRLDEPA